MKSTGIKSFLAGIPYLGISIDFNVHNIYGIDGNR